MTNDRDEYERMKYGGRDPEGREQIDAANAYFQKHWRPFTYQPPEWVEKLKDAPKRLREHPAQKPGSFMFGGYKSIQVQVDGKWYDLCRTDLVDNVATSGGYDPSAEDPVTRIRLTNTYGARVTEDTIFVIDAWSDH